VSRVRENRMPGSMGGSWRRCEPWWPIVAALRKLREMSPVIPKARYLASSLPDLKRAAADVSQWIPRSFLLW